VPKLKRENVWTLNYCSLYWGGGRWVWLRCQNFNRHLGIIIIIIIMRKFV